MRGQALGLAEAIGGKIEVKTVVAKAPWRWLPGHLAPKRMAWVVANPGEFAGPLPHLVISCGRRSVPTALALRRAGVLAVHVQDPQVPPSAFDLVVPPRHDSLSGMNVFPTAVAIHRVTPEKLAAARAEWGPQFTAKPRPWIAVLIGGKSRAYSFSEADAQALATQLQALQQTGASLFITTSRRTGEANTKLLREALPDAYFWSGEADGPNPLMGLLALPDHIVATCDSASMLSEAVSTGTPVHVVELPGGRKRFRRFLDGLYQDGYARRFTGAPLPGWQYTPPTDTADAAEAIRRLLTARLSAS
jgi:mitochondrial fission protein ELM1